MTFININNIELNNSQKSIILFNLDNRELISINNMSRAVGIKNIIKVNSKNANSIIEDIIDNKISDDNEELISQKAIIFNNIAPKQMNFILDTLKKIKANNIYKATTTPTSLKWSIKTLIQNLVEERESLKNKNSIHK